jgi:hypothetical protein
MISIDDAARTPGAYLLRVGTRIGHIVISQGNGDTIEAMGRNYGVREGKAGGRRWTMGVLPSGIEYIKGSAVEVQPPGVIFRLTSPRMQGEPILVIQRALLRAGFNPIDLDGIYGSETANAVMRFQTAKGLVEDSEVGPQTLLALGVR